MKKCDVVPQKFHIRKDVVGAPKGSSAISLEINFDEYLVSRNVSAQSLLDVSRRRVKSRLPPEKCQVLERLLAA